MRPVRFFSGLLPILLCVSAGQPVQARSLYLQQPQDRPGPQAVADTTAPAQRSGRVRDRPAHDPGSALAAATPLAARLLRVENGLRGPLHFQGEPGWSLEERMRHYGVPGLSLAIIEDGHIVATRAYGVADRLSGAKTTPNTLFQAASVSKPVTAFAALRMVQRDELALDRPVNDQLRRWKIPDNDFTRGSPVTLAQLLSHTAGLTVHGFMGYEEGQALPGLVDILDGKPPANSAPVRVDQVPGSSWRYSGGGYTVAEVLMADVAQRSFTALLDEQVLGPIGMHDSHFGTPIDARRTAAGVMPDGRDVPGRYKVHPESAAAALWSTPTDLAAFLIEVQRALRGNSPLLKAESAETMLREVRDGYALGFALTRVNGTAWFGHDGWNDGFNTHMVGNRTGQGVVVMINANQPELMQELRRAVAAEFHWPGHVEFTREPFTAAALAALPGRYRYNDEQFIRVDRVGDGLVFAYGGEPPVPMVAIGGDRYVRQGSDTVLGFPMVGGRPAAMRFSASGGSAGEYARLGEDERAPRERLYAGERDAALAAYRALAAKGGIIGSQDYLNRQGYRLLEYQRPAAAVQLLALVAALHPDSANAWDSLGEAQVAAGDVAAARDAYRRALALDPALATAIAALKALDDRRQP